MTVAMKQALSSNEPMRGSANATSVTETLAEVLAETYRLMVKSQVYHWNVIGPMFPTIHDMTEAHYSDMFAASDVLAERIRALGRPALLSPESLTAGPDEQSPNAGLSAMEMVKDLLADHERLVRRMRTLIERAEAAGDPVTADLATERAAFHEKTAWMLRATSS